MRRIGGWVVIGGIMLCVACNGFPDPVPIEEAERKPEKYLSYDLGQAAPVLSIDGQRWVVLPGATVVAAASAFRPLAADAGGALSALAWDQPPYDALYAHIPNGRILRAAELR
jgi:hypothetical protein